MSTFSRLVASQSNDRALESLTTAQMDSGRYTACAASFGNIEGVRDWNSDINCSFPSVHVHTRILSTSAYMRIAILPSPRALSPVTCSGTKVVTNSWRSCSHRPWHSVANPCMRMVLRPGSRTDFCRLVRTGTTTRPQWRHKGGNVLSVFGGFGDGDRDHAMDAATNVIQSTSSNNLGDIDSLRPTFANVEDRLASHSRPRYESRPSPTGISSSPAQPSPPVLDYTLLTPESIEEETHVAESREGQVALEGCVDKIIASDSDTGWTVAHVNPSLLPPGWMSGRSVSVQKYRAERNLGMEEGEKVVVVGKLGGISQGQRLRFWGVIRDSRHGGHAFLSDNVEELTLETEADMIE